MKISSRITSALAPVAVTSTLSLAFVFPALTPTESGTAARASEAVVASIEGRMIAEGVSSDARASVVSALNRGETLDVFTDAVPVIEERADGADRVTTMSYPDGSMRKVTLHGEGGARTGLSGCSSASGWKTNCKVSVWDPISSARFFVDYQTSGSGKAKVRSFHGETCAVIGGSCSLSSPKGIARATQSSAGPAWARLSYRANAGPIHAAGEFGLRVTGTSARAY